MNILRLGSTAVVEKEEQKYTVECPSCSTVFNFRYSEAKYIHRDKYDGGDVLQVNCPLCGETRRIQP